MGISAAEMTDPQSARSFGFAMGMNFAPGGTTQTVEVTPSDRRIKGTTENAKAQRDSITRQYRSDDRAVSAA
jgi:hypothetical protein